jgi:hypothetical protein
MTSRTSSSSGDSGDPEMRMAEEVAKGDFPLFDDADGWEMSDGSRRSSNAGSNDFCNLSSITFDPSESANRGEEIVLCCGFIGSPFESIQVMCKFMMHDAPGFTENIEINGGKGRSTDCPKSFLCPLPLAGAAPFVMLLELMQAGERGIHSSYRANLPEDLHASFDQLHLLGTAGR